MTRNCEHCGVELTPRTEASSTVRRDRKYCDDKCRFAAYRSKHGTPARDAPCAYCGAPSECVDNVPPLGVRQIVVSDDTDIEMNSVRSCEECRLILRGCWQFAICDRRQVVKLALRRRYRGLLDTKATHGGATLRLMQQSIRLRLKWNGEQNVGSRGNCSSATKQQAAAESDQCRRVGDATADRGGKEGMS